MTQHTKAEILEWLNVVSNSENTSNKMYETIRTLIAATPEPASEADWQFYREGVLGPYPENEFRRLHDHWQFDSGELGSASMVIDQLWKEIDRLRAASGNAVRDDVIDEIAHFVWECWCGGKDIKEMPDKIRALKNSTVPCTPAADTGDHLTGKDSSHVSEAPLGAANEHGEVTPQVDSPAPREETSTDYWSLASRLERAGGTRLPKDVDYEGSLYHEAADALRATSSHAAKDVEVVREAVVSIKREINGFYKIRAGGYEFAGSYDYILDELEKALAALSRIRRAG